MYLPRSGNGVQEAVTHCFLMIAARYVISITDEDGCKEIDFTPPFRRVSMLDAVIPSLPLSRGVPSFRYRFQ